MSALIEVLAWLAGGAVAIVGALLWGRREGRQQERARRSAEEARDALETRRRMDDANSDLGDDPDVLRDWLRTRGRK